MATVEASSEMIERVSQLFKVLSDGTRLQILVLLSKGEANVSKIASDLAMEQSAVSHQLKLLKLNCLVKSRKEGKSVFYSLDDEHVLDILLQTIQHLEHS